MRLLKAMDFSKEIVRSALSPGSIAVDATVGNGHDTLFLAERTGAAGRVYGFDIQESALHRARRRLEDAGVVDRVTLYHRGHEALDAVLPSEAHGRVRAVMFNLGYLPGGGEKTCITRPATTQRALQAAAGMLAPGGIISVVLYVGHPGGAEEADAVEDWAAALDQAQYHALSYRFINQRHAPPRLVLVERRP